MTDPLTRAGWPRPIVAGWPIPWVSPSDNLATMDGARIAAAASGAICAVCGLDYASDEEAFACVRAESVPKDLSKIAVRAMDNAIMHRRCLLLSLARCPRLIQLVRDCLLKVVRTRGNLSDIVRLEKHGEVYSLIMGKDCELVAIEDIKRNGPTDQ